MVKTIGTVQSMINMLWPEWIGNCDCKHQVVFTSIEGRWLQIWY